MIEASSPVARDLCLIGTWRNVDEGGIAHVRSAIERTGAWASWWSFPIRDEFAERLQAPFWLYLNAGSATIVCRMRVEEVRTTADVEGMESPWPQHTDEEQLEKRRAGEKKSRVFRTWFRVTAIERLDRPLKLSDFEPAEGTTESALLNQSAFGYAYLRTGPQDRQPKLKAATNLILYGPPGTGKTFSVIERALRLIEPSAHYASRDAMQRRFRELQNEGRILSVAFHPNYTYEEFVEGLRPVRSAEQDTGVGFDVVPGPLRLIAAKASMESEHIDRHIELLKQKCSDVDGAPVAMRTTTGKAFSLSYRGGRTFRVRPVNLDPAAPDYPVSIDAIRRVHGGADYRSEYNPSYIRGVLDYLYANGLSRTASGAAFQPCVLIIDEINRGNLAKIFGELITLLEPDKRLGAPEALRLRLPYSGDLFGLPTSVSVLATMNTADRSIALLDIALRRRFRFEEIAPQAGLLGVVDSVDLRRLLEVINDRLEFQLDRDHRIGHAYFMQVRNLDALVECFRFQIIPLLQEYFFDDWSRVHMVLSTQEGSSPFIRDRLAYGERLFPGFKADLTQPERTVYEVTPAEAWDAAAFRGIYEQVVPGP